MTKIKLCGLSRPCDIMAANGLKPDYIGFVFAPRTRRYVTPQTAAELKRLLAPGIQAVGVFVREDPRQVAELLNSGVIDLAQLHGGESEDYIRQLREQTSKPLIQAFRVERDQDLEAAERSPADMILLDSGSGGTGTVFDWTLIRGMKRPYFLAGGLDLRNVRAAMETLHPYALDISSGIEENGVKDPVKMAAFVTAVRAAANPTF